MTYYHIIIQQERRSPRVTEFGEDRSRLALQISTTKMVGEKEAVIDRTQLHTMMQYGSRKKWVKNMTPNPQPKPADWDDAEDGIYPSEIDQGHFEIDTDFSDPQYVGVFEWDGRAPYIIAHKGDYAARTMHYAGWPDVAKEQYDALPRPDPL